MIKVGFIHQVLAYLAAAAALVSLILAGVSRLVAHPVGFHLSSYVAITIVAMLFAIYFFAGGIFFRNTQVWFPLAARVRKSRKVGPLPLRLFDVSGNNKGLLCPFKPVLCQTGYCEDCQLYLDWKKRGEILVVCASCSKEISRSPTSDQPEVHFGICPECLAELKPQYF